MNRTLCLITTMMIGILLCGCGKEEGNSRSSDTKPRDEAVKVTLQTAIPVGEYRIEHSSKSDNTVHMTDSQSMHSRVNFRLQFHAAVEPSDDDTGKVMTIRYERIEQAIEGPVSVDIDTDSENDDPLTQSYRKILGVPIRVEFDANDEIQRVSGFETLWSKLSSPSSTSQRLMIIHLRKAAGREVIEHIFDYRSIPIPDQPVAPSAAWKAKLALPLELIPGAKYEAKCTFEDLNESEDSSQIATLSTTGVFGVDEPEEVDLLQSGKRPMLLKTMRLDLQAKAQIIVESGLVQSKQVDYSGNFTLAPKSSPDREMTSELSGENVTHIQRVKK